MLDKIYFQGMQSLLQSLSNFCWPKNLIRKLKKFGNKILNNYFSEYNLPV